MKYKLRTPKHQQTVIQSVAEVFLWPFFDAVDETVGSSHTPACCLSKLRSSLEAGKKQGRVWLQYSCGVTEMLHYSSFRVPLVLLLSPYGDSEMARNGFEDGSKWCAIGNTCSSVNKADFKASRTYVQGTLNLYTCFEAIL